MTETTERLYKTSEVAEKFRCSRKKVASLAAELKVGLNLGGSAGFRFSEADVEAMRESLARDAA